MNAIALEFKKNAVRTSKDSQRQNLVKTALGNFEIARATGFPDSKTGRKPGM
jgi:hypothetical protein